MHTWDFGSARSGLSMEGAAAGGFVAPIEGLAGAIDPALLRLVGTARDSLHATLRRQRADAAAASIRQWKGEGVYPFTGPAEDAIDVARREIFDICALNLHEHLDAFRSGSAHDRRFALQMLRAVIEDSPASLKRMLTEVLSLPAEKASELSTLFQMTSLVSIIEASKMVTERLQFLAGLQALLFELETKRTLKERGQLHSMLANEAWIFGEEFLLSSSDENLNTVLQKHGSRLDETREPVLRDDGTEGVVDFVLGREVPAYANIRREFLVVELKRPSRKIDLAAKGQIESYAMAVAMDERFDMKHTHWTFLAVSNELTPEAIRTLRYPTGAFGCFHEDPNLRIGLATWGGILNASRVRLEAFRTRLNCVVSRDEGMAWLRQRYAEYLPEAVHAVLSP